MQPQIQKPIYFTETARHKSVKIPTKGKRMSHPSSLITTAVLAAYSLSAAAFLFLQETFHLAGNDLPSKWLLWIAIVFAIFASTISYFGMLKQTKTSFEWRGYGLHLGLSSFMSMVLGLILEGYVVATVWLTAILISSFFPNFFIAIIPQIITKKINDTLHLTIDSETITETTTLKTEVKTSHLD
jgi:hypothetical protein